MSRDNEPETKPKPKPKPKVIERPPCARCNSRSVIVHTTRSAGSQTVRFWACHACGYYGTKTSHPASWVLTRAALPRQNQGAGAPTAAATPTAARARRPSARGRKGRR